MESFGYLKRKCKAVKTVMSLLRSNSSFSLIQMGKGRILFYILQGLFAPIEKEVEIASYQFVFANCPIQTSVWDSNRI
jgi:hypothetical protein